MRLFNDTDLNDIGGLPAIRYKGGGSQTTTQTRTIPDQTAEEAQLQNSATNYANNSMGTSNGLLNNANSVIGNFNNTYDNYNNTANNVSNGYAGLINGELPSTYATARQQALSADLEGTIGSAINSLASRGVVNSSARDANFDSITKNASNTLARNYSSDMNSYAGLLGNTSANNTSNLNNYTGLISSLLGNSDQLANNTSDLFNTMYSGRMGTGTTQSTTTGGNGNSTAQMVGSLGSAAILCFIGGTKITTPDGEKNIEDIKLGDLVVAIDGVQTVTYVQEPCISNDEYMAIEFEDKRVTTTAMQTFIINDIDILAKYLPHSHAEVETVYDFSCTGSNTYYANGFLVRGR